MNYAQPPLSRYKGFTQCASRVVALKGSDSLCVASVSSTQSEHLFYIFVSHYVDTHHHTALKHVCHLVATVQCLATLVLFCCVATSKHAEGPLRILKMVIRTQTFIYF